MKIFDIICVTCKKPIEYSLISVAHVSKWGIITKALHKECYEKDRDKWDKNNWEVVKPNPHISQHLNGELDGQVRFTREVGIELAKQILKAVK